jgi:hypothetical protein
MRDRLSSAGWRKPLAGIMAVGLVGLGLQGCTALKKLSVDMAVARDASALVKRPGLQMTFSLDETPRQLERLSHGQLPPKEAQALSDTSIVVDIHSGYGAALDHAIGSREDFSLQVRSDGNTPFEEETIHGALYTRVILADLHKDFGVRRGALRRFHRQADRAAKHVPGLKTLISGGWVVVPKAQIKVIDKHLGQVPGMKSELRPGLDKRLRNTALKALMTSASISADGSAGAYKKYTLSVAIRPLLRTLFYSPAMRAITKGDHIGSLPHLIIRSVPAGTSATAELYAAHGSLQKVAVNLTQFGHPVMPLWLDIKLAAGPRLVAPRHARRLDVEALVRPVIVHSGSGSSAAGGLAGAGGAGPVVSRLLPEIKAALGA